LSGAAFLRISRAGPRVTGETGSETRGLGERGEFEVDEKLMVELLKVTDAVLEKVAGLPLPK
jgi:hypothetical protein